MAIKPARYRLGREDWEPALGALTGMSISIARKTSSTCSVPLRLDESPARLGCTNAFRQGIQA